MPVTIQGERPGGQFTSSLSGVKYDYTYPIGDWTPGGELHERLKRHILELAQDSWSVISKRHPSWDLVDDTCSAFIPLDQKEKKVQAKDGRKPVSIVVPITYSIKETLLAHLLAIYGADNIWQYDPRGPEDVGGAALLENIIDAQARRFKHLGSLNTFCSDAISKGIGVMAPVWETKYGLTEQIVQDPLTGQAVNINQPSVLFQGNRLRNINPRLYLPDPNVPAHEVQDGEFVAWIWRDNANSILEEEFNNPGTIFNARYLQHLSDGRSTIFKERNQGSVKSNNINSKPIDRIFIYQRIIPAQFGLGPSEYPEIWCFQLAGDQVIIAARPLGLRHNMYPVVVAAPDTDGYSTCPIARLEVTMGLQRAADFLYNIHMASMRKNMHGTTVYDPSVINTNDLVNDNPFKYVRVRRQMFGLNAIDKGFRHFPHPDTTGGNVNEVGFIDQMASKYLGAVESMQGVMGRGERRSAQEARMTHMAGVGRVEKMARIISEQALMDMSYMIASHTQQFMAGEQYISITGRLQDELIGLYGLDPGTTRVPVGPADIANIEFDVIMRDGSLPGSDFIQEHVQLMQLALSDPKIYQQYDTARWMGELAKQMGIKNINDFRIRANVQTTQEVQQGLEEGTLEKL